jgi:exodeoxyribonuclease VII small subunit
VAKRTNEQSGAGESGDVSYEQAIAAVEAIVEKIESGELGLEASVAEYEKAVALLTRCREVLKRAELRVSELSKQMAESEDGADKGSDPESDAPF